MHPDSPGSDPMSWRFRCRRSKEARSRLDGQETAWSDADPGALDVAYHSLC